MKSAPLTPETTFGYIPSIDANLFSVRADIPLTIAAEQCACSVDAATQALLTTHLPNIARIAKEYAR